MKDRESFPTARRHHDNRLILLSLFQLYWGVYQRYNGYDSATWVVKMRPFGSSQTYSNALIQSDAVICMCYPLLSVLVSLALCGIAVDGERFASGSIRFYCRSECSQRCFSRHGTLVHLMCRNNRLSSSVPDTKARNLDAGLSTRKHRFLRWCKSQVPVLHHLRHWCRNGSYVLVQYGPRD